MIHNGNQIEGQKTLVLDKARDIDEKLYEYLGKILRRPEVGSREIKRLSGLVSRLNEEFLSTPEIGFYLEISGYNDKILLIPHEIVRMKEYEHPDGRDVILLNLRQIALSISWAKQGIMHPEKSLFVFQEIQPLIQLKTL